DVDTGGGAVNAGELFGLAQVDPGAGERFQQALTGDVSDQRAKPGTVLGGAIDDLEQIGLGADGADVALEGAEADAVASEPVKLVDFSGGPGAVQDGVVDLGAGGRLDAMKHRGYWAVKVGRGLGHGGLLVEKMVSWIVVWCGGAGDSAGRSATARCLRG